MVAVLDDWDGRCVSVLAEIEGQVQDVRRNAAERRRKQLEGERAIEKAMGEEGAKDKGKAAGKRGAADGENVGGYDVEGAEEMDVDDVLVRGGVRNAKRGGGRFGGLGKRLG